MSISQQLRIHAENTSLADADMLDELLNSLEIDGSDLTIVDLEKLRKNIGVLPAIGAFGEPEAAILAHGFARRIAQRCGIYPASIEALYRRLAAGEISGFTVPAMNMRAITFESARGVFQAMRDNDVGAAIFELSRGEIGFTGQRPQEYATAILCAAISEGHKGPLFLQGDHFQISSSRYKEDPDKEMQAVRNLIVEAIEAGFYNIDIDCSTLVDLSVASVADQQKYNIQLTAELLRHVRKHEPEGVTISTGGEIGEVGETNSTPEEVEAYLTGIRAEIGPDMVGLSKLSIQSGTRHGGNVLPDGSFGEMEVDFPLIAKLTEACREVDGLAGCVQHGASMLSLEKISNLPAASCIEVHLAAAFLNAVYDNLPGKIVQQADDWVIENFANEWREDWSRAQFLHHARRYPIGPFKKKWWEVVECHDAIRQAVRQKAAAYFTALKVCGTRTLVEESIKPVEVAWTPSLSANSGSLDEAAIRDLAS